jgi:ABC-type ATPase involved in cell division
MGVSADEKYKRAVAALELVGLGDKVENLPNQLS